MLCMFIYIRIIIIIIIYLIKDLYVFVNGYKTHIVKSQKIIKKSNP